MSSLRDIEYVTCKDCGKTMEHDLLSSHRSEHYYPRPYGELPKLSAQQQLIAMQNPWKCNQCGLRFRFKWKLLAHRDETHRY